MNNTLRPFPSLMYFPGIRSQPIWDSNQFKSVKILQDNFQVIKNEFLNSQQNLQLKNDYKLKDNEHSLHKGEWEWYSYIMKGSKQDLFKEQFPLTNEIISQMDDIMLSVPFAYTFFSRLSPSSKISPHYGPSNIRLRIHLGIDIPSDCSMRVAEEEVKWEEGKCVVFDDTYLHEVENMNISNFRTILLVDIWHPDIREEEREAIVKMFGGAYEKGWLKR